jgi:hypothetical protein
LFGFFVRQIIKKDNRLFVKYQICLNRFFLDFFGNSLLVFHLNLFYSVHFLLNLVNMMRIVSLLNLRWNGNILKEKCVSGIVVFLCWCIWIIILRRDIQFNFILLSLHWSLLDLNLLIYKFPTKKQWNLIIFYCLVGIYFKYSSQHE